MRNNKKCKSAASRETTIQVTPNNGKHRNGGKKFGDYFLRNFTQKTNKQKLLIAIFAMPFIIWKLFKLSLLFLSINTRNERNFLSNVMLRLEDFYGLIEGKLFSPFADFPFLLDSLSSRIMDQHYCLRWNKHQTNLTDVLASQRELEKFCDVTLSVGAANKTLKVNLLKAPIKHRQFSSLCSMTTWRIPNYVTNQFLFLYFVLSKIRRHTRQFYQHVVRTLKISSSEIIARIPSCTLST